MNFRFIKGFVFVGCLIALLSESLDLYKDYKSYQTVVSVNIGKQRIIEYPGVSVCESHHLVQMKDSFFGYPKLPIQQGVWIKAKQKNAQRLYEMVNEGAEYNDLLSFFFEVLNNTLAKDAFGPIDDDFITCTTQPNGQSCQPINFISGFFSQCKTFFNAIHYVNGSTEVFPPQTFEIIENAKDNEMALIKIQRNKTNDYHSNKITIVIFPSNELPLFPTQKLGFRQNQLKFGRRYDVTFAKATIKKLNEPYIPHCIDYIKENSQFRSYYDCTVRCLHRKIFHNFNCSFIGIDLVLNDGFDDKKMCGKDELENFDDIFFGQIVPQCKYELCLPDCTHEIYKYEVKDVTESPTFIDNKIENDTILINILPQEVDEFTYIHQPKILLNDLISNFGGLLSLWLGFSFFSLYTFIESQLRRKYFVSVYKIYVYKIYVYKIYVYKISFNSF